MHHFAAPALLLWILFCFGSGTVVTDGQGLFKATSVANLFDDPTTAGYFLINKAIGRDSLSGQIFSTRAKTFVHFMARHDNIYFHQRNDDVYVDLSFFLGVCHLQTKTSCPAKLKQSSAGKQDCKLLKKQLIQHCTKSHSDRTTTSCTAHYNMFGVATLKERQTNLMDDATAEFWINTAKDYLEFDRYILWKDNLALHTPATVQPIPAATPIPPRVGPGTVDDSQTCAVTIHHKLYSFNIGQMLKAAQDSSAKCIRSRRMDVKDCRNVVMSAMVPYITYAAATVLFGSSTRNVKLSRDHSEIHGFCYPRDKATIALDTRRTRNKEKDCSGGDDDSDQPRCFYSDLKRNTMQSWLSQSRASATETMKIKNADRIDTFIPLWYLLWAPEEIWLLYDAANTNVCCRLSRSGFLSTKPPGFVIPTNKVCLCDSCGVSMDSITEISEFDHGNSNGLMTTYNRALAGGSPWFSVFEISQRDLDEDQINYANIKFEKLDFQFMPPPAITITITGVGAGNRPIKCIQSNTRSIGKDCKCAAASTTNECIKDQYCYDDECQNDPHLFSLNSDGHLVLKSIESIQMPYTTSVPTARQLANRMTEKGSYQAINNLYLNNEKEKRYATKQFIIDVTNAAAAPNDGTIESVGQRLFIIDNDATTFDSKGHYKEMVRVIKAAGKKNTPPSKLPKKGEPVEWNSAVKYDGSLRKLKQSKKREEAQAAKQATIEGLKNFQFYDSEDEVSSDSDGSGSESDSSNTPILYTVLRVENDRVVTNPSFPNHWDLAYVIQKKQEEDEIAIVDDDDGAACVGGVCTHEHGDCPAHGETADEVSKRKQRDREWGPMKKTVTCPTDGTLDGVVVKTCFMNVLLQLREYHSSSLRFNRIATVAIRTSTHQIMTLMLLPDSNVIGVLLGGFVTTKTTPSPVINNPSIKKKVFTVLHFDKLNQNGPRRVSEWLFAHAVDHGDVVFSIHANGPDHVFGPGSPMAVVVNPLADPKIMTNKHYLSESLHETIHKIQSNLPFVTIDAERSVVAPSAVGQEHADYNTIALTRGKLRRLDALSGRAGIDFLRHKFETIQQQRAYDKQVNTLCDYDGVLSITQDFKRNIGLCQTPWQTKKMYYAQPTGKHFKLETSVLFAACMY